ncbi:uncharacterized protein LOC128214634 [Mya arenaria]|uniref:uncharacterized protein LOC128214634 n=1 Tax=Mya arenaria TaxID=6604 RepID=UPI0022E5C47F|nr:uncharacterized protein LOC128214634 [Mya arenaria]
MDRESMQKLSLRLSRVLEDIGVSRYIRTRRKRTLLMEEAQQRIKNELHGYKFIPYTFGSQTEGTTTLGMESDIDTLTCDNNWPVILDWSEWRQGKGNLLVVKNIQSPPQHCWLQRVIPDLPLPWTGVNSPSDMVDSEGRVLMTNTQIVILETFRQNSESGEVVQHGPSKSMHENLDLILAYHCTSLPEECKFLFHRPRPGHWPRPDTLTTARQSGVFLVPQGYTEDPSIPVKCRSTTFHVPPEDMYYPLYKREWRFSTSIMERLLVFDMNIIQHKVYVFLKMLRKSIIKQVVDDRFSTFHMKTAILFTIETYPPNIWSEDNLAQCVIYCMTTLLRWLKIRLCPHYTISGVNLFTGKLFKHEQYKLHSMITEIINNNFQCLYTIEMDDLGRRMSSVISSQNIGVDKRCELNKVQMTGLYYWWAREIIRPENLYFNEIKNLDQYLETLTFQKNNGTEIEQEAAFLFMSLVCGINASIQASRCIYQGQPITHNILQLYQLSFDSDLLSSRLKFGSMLYCSGQYEAAANCLTYCEGLLGTAVWQCCECRGRQKRQPNNEFREKTVNTPFKDMLQKYTALHVIFTQDDIHCVPQHIVYEMFRTVGDDDRQQRHPAVKYKWMDYIVFDSVPFLHYLQYLTHSCERNQPERKFRALNNLYYYISLSQGHGHIDTAWNMLGHCYELENKLDLAWSCYTKSLQLFPRNNAANWHVARIMNQHLIVENIYQR